MSNASKESEVSSVEPAAIVRAPQPQQHSQAIEPQNFGELKALAQHAARSRFFGGAGDESQALVLMMRGRDLGLSYAQALAAFHVISGKPTLSADAMVAICLARPDLCEYFRHVSSDNTQATFVTKRVGDPEPQRETYTMADADREELSGKAMWKKFPKRMLKARAKANLARDTYPELLLGIYSPEEMPSGDAPRAAGLELVGEVVREPAVASVTSPANTIPTPPPSEPAAGPKANVVDGTLPENKEQTIALMRLTSAVDDCVSLKALTTLAADAKKELRGEFLGVFRERYTARYVAIQNEEKAADAAAATSESAAQ